jgi:hypothetical protein
LTETVERTSGATEYTPPNPDGECWCRCGQITNRAKTNQVSGGIKHRVGDHLRFVRGHSTHLRRDVVNERESQEQREESWERFIRSRNDMPTPHTEDLIKEERRERLQDQRRRNAEEWGHYYYYRRLAITLKAQAAHAEERAEALLGQLETGEA